MLDAKAAVPIAITRPFRSVSIGHASFTMNPARRSASSRVSKPPHGRQAVGTQIGQDVLDAVQAIRSRLYPQAYFTSSVQEVLLNITGHQPPLLRFGMACFDDECEYWGQETPEPNLIIPLRLDDPASVRQALAVIEALMQVLVLTVRIKTIIESRENSTCDSVSTSEVDFVL